MVTWKILPQIEKLGKQERTVLVKRLRGFFSNGIWMPLPSAKDQNGNQTKWFSCLIDVKEGGTNFMLPRKLTFSQQWKSKEDGSQFVAGVLADGSKVPPDPKRYYCLSMVTVKTERKSYNTEQKVSKRCVSKVTQLIPVDKDTRDAKQDADDEWYVVQVVDNRPFDLNDKDYNSQIKGLHSHLSNAFGVAIADEYLDNLDQRINE